MTVITPSIWQRFTSRKLLIALMVFAIAGLGGVLGYVQEPDQAKTLGFAAPIVYLIIQGAIDFIKTKKVYEVQAAAAAATGVVPPVVAGTSASAGPDPHTALNASPGP